MNVARHHIIMHGTFHWFQICIVVKIREVNEALSIEEVYCCTVVFCFHACLFTKLHSVRFFGLLSTIIHVRLQFEDTYAFYKTKLIFKDRCLRWIPFNKAIINVFAFIAPLYPTQTPMQIILTSSWSSLFS